jgi:hypothetical protein
MGGFTKAMCEGDARCVGLFIEYRNKAEIACNASLNPFKCKEDYLKNVPADPAAAAKEIKMNEDNVRYLAEKYKAHVEGTATKTEEKDQTEVKEVVDPDTQTTQPPRAAPPAPAGQTTVIVPEKKAPRTVKEEGKLEEKFAKEMLEKPSKDAIVRELASGYVLYSIYGMGYYKKICQEQNNPCGFSKCYDYQDVQRNLELAEQMKAQAIKSHISDVLRMGGKSHQSMPNPDAYLLSLPMIGYEACVGHKNTDPYTIRQVLVGVPAGVKLVRVPKAESK